MDVATFFPSLDGKTIHDTLAPLGRGEADLFLRELERTGIRGLPVGGWPQRLVAEAVLDKKVDRPLMKLEREHVRAMDDMVIGVESREDAEALIVQVAEALRPLDLNKSKTRIENAADAAPKEEDPIELARGLLLQHDPDRVRLARALGRVRRQEAPGWDRRKRQRWLRLLVSAVVRHRVCVSNILRLIKDLTPGTEGPPWDALFPLLDSQDAVHRAEAARFLSQQLREDAQRHREIRAHLTWRAVGDTSALVRREALLGLVRLGAKAEVMGVVRGDPPTELDRGAWIIGAGVLDAPLPFQLFTPYQRLLHRAACEHGPRDI